MKYEISINEVKKSFASQKTQCVSITKACQAIICIQIIGYGGDGNDDDDYIIIIIIIIIIVIIVSIM